MEKIKEVILCKYGEIVLKGANRSTFEAMLSREIKKRASHYGQFKVTREQSTIYVEPLSDYCDVDGMVECAKRIFGIAGVGRAAVTEKNMDSIMHNLHDFLF